VQTRFQWLAIFYRMQYAGDCLARTAWRTGRADCPVMFNAPDDPAPRETGRKTRTRERKAAV
jgi:hypothetical protein